MKVVASRLVCRLAILKIPVRADMSTGTVILVHIFAAAKPASKASARALCVYIVSSDKMVRTRVQRMMPRIEHYE